MKVLSKLLESSLVGFKVDELLQTLSLELEDLNERFHNDPFGFRQEWES